MVEMRRVVVILAIITHHVYYINIVYQILQITWYIRQMQNKKCCRDPFKMRTLVVGRFLALPIETDS